MLQIFRNKQPFTGILVILYFLILGTNTWLYPISNLATFQELPSTLSLFVLNWTIDPFVNRICFSILILFQAFFLNSIVSYFKLTRDFTFVPAICFIALHFSYPDIDCCSPVFIANTFLLWTVFSLFASYDKKASLGTIFNIGFSVSIAALFYHGYVVYFLWSVLALLIIRSFDLQEFLLLIGGIFVPFFLVGCYHYLNETLSIWLQDDIAIHWSTMNFLYDTNIALYLILGVLMVSFLLAGTNIQGLYNKTTSREKKYINAIFLMPIIGLLSFFVQNNLYSYHYLTFFVPISILLSISLLSYKNLAVSEGFHFTLFMICLGTQYQALFFG